MRRPRRILRVIGRDRQGRTGGSPQRGALEIKIANPRVAIERTIVDECAKISFTLWEAIGVGGKIGQFTQSLRATVGPALGIEFVDINHDVGVRRDSRSTA